MPAEQKNRLGRTADRPYWVLILSVIIRAIHQVGAAVFLAAFLLNDPVDIPVFYTGLAGATGILLLFTEGLRHRQLLKETSGVATVLKLVLLGLIYHGWVPAIPAVLFVFLLASFFSHAPKNIRHRLIF